MGPVLWLDETKIDIFENKHQRWVWRKQKDSHAEKYIIPAVYGGGIFNVVGLFFFQGPWSTCKDTWYHGLYQVPADIKSKPDGLC